MRLENYSHGASRTFYKPLRGPVSKKHPSCWWGRWAPFQLDAAKGLHDPGSSNGGQAVHWAHRWRGHPLPLISAPGKLAGGPPVASLPGQSIWHTLSRWRGKPSQNIPRAGRRDSLVSVGGFSELVGSDPPGEVEKAHGVLKVQVWDSSVLQERGMVPGSGSVRL